MFTRENETNGSLTHFGGISRSFVHRLIFSRKLASDKAGTIQFRVELGDIEGSLMCYPNITNCAVHLTPTASDKSVLAAYFSANSPARIDAADLRAFLQQSLPDYMVPAHFVELDALPLNTNGKVDRKALPSINDIASIEHVSEGDITEPEKDLDIVIVNAFKKRLGVHEIGIDHNFFELGGDSMSAIELIVSLNEELSLELPLATLLTASTPRALRDLVEHQQQGHVPLNSVVTLRESKGGLDVFCLLGIHIYSDLAHALGEGFNVHALLSKSENEFLRGLNTEQGKNTLNLSEVAQEYLEQILKIKPQGPYYLFGFSSGGVVAVEVARMLRDLNHEVAQVCLLDTILPRGINNKLELKLRELAQNAKHTLGSSLGYLRHRSDQHLSSSKSQVQSKFADERLNQLWHSIEKWCKKHHRYDGPVTLFRATDVSKFSHVSLKEDYGWSAIASGTLSVFDIDCDHASLVHGKQAEEIATLLKSNQNFTTPIGNKT